MKSERAAYYNQHLRNPEAKRFYNSTAWRNCRSEYIRQHPFCQRCERVTADHVHHIIPLARCTEEQRLDPQNLQSLCVSCHNIIESEITEPEPDQISGTLDVHEDDEFYYDEEAATAPIRFAAKFCHHWRGPLRGQPFILHPIQQSIIKPVFGYLSRETKTRRFRHLWIEGSVGCGKTPILSILGLHGLIGDKENGAQIVCIASDHKTADYAFQGAKNFIKNGPLRALVRKGSIVVNQYEIRYQPTDSAWQITSGKGGKAGGAPSLVLFDEIHQVKDREGYDDLQGRMSKRTQPLMVCATNAAKKPNSLYADLHEEAEQTLTAGPRANRRLFPVLWSAPKDDDPASPETWIKANPLLGITIQPETVAEEWKRAKGSPALENRFRLQYLGQQVSDVSKWLDMEKWKACCKPFSESVIKDAPLYIGLDLSLGDDWCSAVDCYPLPEMYFVSAKVWLPRITAERYEEKDLIPYSEWENEIELLDTPTIGTSALAKIAEYIIEKHKAHPIKAVCYDAAYSSQLIPTLQAAGINCLPIKQGWSVSAGCSELDRRLIEQSITISPSSAFDFCAENVQVFYDRHGNYWPVKPGANADTKSAGKRSQKIDCISALVTALTEARKHDFPKPAPEVGAYMIEL